MGSNQECPSKKLRGSSSEPEEHRGKLGTGENRFEGLAVDVCCGCVAARQSHCCDCLSGLFPSFKLPMHVSLDCRAQSLYTGHH